jgi:hypothetical protein
MQRAMYLIFTSTTCSIFLTTTPRMDTLEGMATRDTSASKLPCIRSPQHAHYTFPGQHGNLQMFCPLFHRKHAPPTPLLQPRGRHRGHRLFFQRCHPIHQHRNHRRSLRLLPSSPALPHDHPLKFRAPHRSPNGPLDCPLNDRHMNQHRDRQPFRLDLPRSCPLALPR